jgi:hypothetical protein
VVIIQKMANVGCVDQTMCHFLDEGLGLHLVKLFLGPMRRRLPLDGFSGCLPLRRVLRGIGLWQLISQGPVEADIKQHALTWVNVSGSKNVLGSVLESWLSILIRVSFRGVLGSVPVSVTLAE